MTNNRLLTGELTKAFREKCPDLTGGLFKISAFYCDNLRMYHIEQVNWGV